MAAQKLIVRLLWSLSEWRAPLVDAFSLSSLN